MSDELSRALGHLTAGDAAAAAAILEGMPEAPAPERLRTHILALARAQLGRFEIALPLFRRLAADDPADPDVSLQFGTCLAGAGQARAAMTVFGRVRWLAQRRPEVYARLGATYFESGAPA